MNSTNEIPLGDQYVHTPLNFVNTAFNHFEIDENPGNKIRQVPGYVYSKVTPTPLKNPCIVSLSPKCLELLDLKYDDIMQNDKFKKLYAELFSGNKLLQGSIPISHNYCGHQFGVFAGQLGDGRAITLGDIRNNKQETWELQLKGAGQTPYSRHADGRAVLRSSIREYLCSEAMFFLGVPTSRAASLIVSDTKVQRDPLYSGNVINEKCAVVMRLAPTFFRFGSFEIFKEKDKYSGSKGPSHGMQEEMMPQMLEFLFKNYYPEIYYGEQNLQDQTRAYFHEITRRTVDLVALWQTVGYVHGVLNTDNMSALGLTIDYGPYGFMEHFNPKFIPNYSDKEGRYSYENQPSICKWNLGKLAEALSPFLDEEESKQYLEENYDKLYSARFLEIMSKKLGFLIEGQNEKVEIVDQEYQCIQSIFTAMEQTMGDFTNTFRILALVSREIELKETDQKAIELLVKHSAPVEHVIALNKPKYSAAALEKIKSILETNPNVLHMFGLDPEEAKKEIEKIENSKSQGTLTQDQKSVKDREVWTKWVQSYKQSLGQMDKSITDEIRKQSMNKVNPKFILRNYLMEEAIRKAEDEDFSKVDELLKMCYDPYNEENISEASTQPPPQWAQDLCVSCSS
eukprot:403353926